MVDRNGEAGEAVEIGNFFLNTGSIGIRQRFGGFGLVPLLGGFIESLVILVKFILQRQWRLLLTQLFFKAVGHGFQGTCNGKGGGRQKFS